LMSLLVGIVVSVVIAACLSIAAILSTIFGMKDEM